MKNQIIVAKDTGYLGSGKVEEFNKQAATAHRLLQGLITASKKRLN